MKLVSIQVGIPQLKNYHGKEISTAIFKYPVQGPVMVKTENIDGDRQADLKVHGGRDKAVYAYSLDAYEKWNEFYQTELAPGSLGENLLIDSFDETKIGLGDIYELGECQLQVVQPRIPCFKLNLRLNDSGAIKTFNTIARSGIYFRVLREGTIDLNQEMRLISRPEEEFVSVADLFKMSISPLSEEEAFRLLKIKSLNSDWRRRIERSLSK